APEGRVGEGGHQDGADRVQQVPSAAEAGPARPLAAGVHADLDRGGAAHHQPAPWAGPGAELLPRRVAREVEHAPARGGRGARPGGGGEGPWWGSGRGGGARSGRVGAMQSPGPAAGAELISTWPPGSVVSVPRPGSAPGAPSRATAVAARCWSTGRAGSRPSK